MLQDIHVPDEQRMIQRVNTIGFMLVSAIYHRRYGSASYIIKLINNGGQFYTTLIDSISIKSMCVADITLFNIHKPPNELGLPLRYQTFHRYHHSLGTSTVTKENRKVKKKDS